MLRRQAVLQKRHGSDIPPVVYPIVLQSPLDAALDDEVRQLVLNPEANFYDCWSLEAGDREKGGELRQRFRAQLRSIARDLAQRVQAISALGWHDDFPIDDSLPPALRANFDPRKTT